MRTGRPPVDLAAHLLRRHVGHRAHHHALAGELGRSAGSRRAVLGAATLARPKSRTFTRPSLVTITLAGFRSRWTMPLSCAAARASASAMAIPRSADGSPPGDDAVEGLTLDELHGQEVDAAASSTEWSVTIFGWLSAATAPGLALEAGQAIRLGRHLGGQHLERHVATELGVGGAVDLAHAAGADRGGDPVVCEVGRS